jgi:hypothetical protein
VKISIAVKLAIASAICAISASASPIGVASATCPGTPISGFGNGAFSSNVWQTCGPVMQTGGQVTIDTTVAANNASLSAVNTFLSPQSVSSQAGITPVAGAALKTTFTSGAGTLSFNYIFASDPSIASFAFLLLDGTQYDLGHNSPMVFLAVNTIATTPMQNIAIGAGTHNIAFGLMNGNTVLADPTLTISNLSAPASTVPEPATFGLLAVALGLLWRRRRVIP